MNRLLAFYCLLDLYMSNTNVVFLFASRLESLNEKRSGVVQMVKLAEKERDSLEVR